MRDMTAACSSFSPMSLLPTLPAEIQELIIDSIASRLFICRSYLNALSVCARVCKLWHSSSLRHQFHDIELPHDLEKRREVNILSLIKTNPRIESCIKSVDIVFKPSGGASRFDDDEFQQVCRIVSRSISHLSFKQVMPDLRSRPLVQNGISLLLGSPSLAHLSFVEDFRSSLLESASQSVAFLSFYSTRNIVLDHEESARLFRSLREVNFYSSNTLIDVMQQTAGLSQIFEHAQHVHVRARVWDIWPEAHWNRNLIWANCTSVDLTFDWLTSEHFLVFTVVLHLIMPALLQN